MKVYPRPNEQLKNQSISARVWSEDVWSERIPKHEMVRWRSNGNFGSAWQWRREKEEVRSRHPAISFRRRVGSRVYPSQPRLQDIRESHASTERISFTARPLGTPTRVWSLVWPKPLPTDDNSWVQMVIWIGGDSKSSSKRTTWPPTDRRVLYFVASKLYSPLTPSLFLLTVKGVIEPFGWHLTFALSYSMTTGGSVHSLYRLWTLPHKSPPVREQYMRCTNTCLRARVGILIIRPSYDKLDSLLFVFLRFNFHCWERWLELKVKQDTERSLGSSIGGQLLT